MMKYFLYIIIVLLAGGCKKIVSVDDARGRLLQQRIFASDTLANNAIAGIYQSFKEIYNRQGSPVIISGLAGDELYDYSSSEFYNGYSLNNIEPENVHLPWGSIYNVIYQANLAEEGLLHSESLTPVLRDYYLGEVKFIRALCYFNLVNFFGDVPLLLTSDVKTNASASRTSKEKVHDQIILDLTTAQNLMTNDVHDADPGRCSQLAVASLLARVYLYNRSWNNAIREADRVLASNRYALIGDLDSFSIYKNTEAIFQLPENGIESNFEAATFIIGAAPFVLCTADLLAAFETGDLRQQNWIGQSVVGNSTYYYPNKYKTVYPSRRDGYNILRLAEQYLIRAEARAQQNTLEDALNDINIVRERAGLDQIMMPISKDSCLALISKERRVEFFAETAHRWNDLKRTGSLGAAVAKVKGREWEANDSLFPIPILDIRRNSNLTQNAGYLY